MHMPSGQDRADEELDEAIRFQGLMPLSWRASRQALTDAELQAVSDSNVSLLDSIMVMDMPASLDNEDRDVNSLELHRLQAKVDLLVGMVSRLLAYHERQPTPVMVTLSSRRVRWQGVLPVSPGDVGIMDVFVHPLAMSPLQLPVVIRDSGIAEIVGMQSSARNAFEKFLFRQHRRHVAEARQARH